MTKNRDEQMKDLEALEALIKDMERALADEGKLSEENQARLERLRQQLKARREELLRAGGDSPPDRSQG